MLASALLGVAISNLAWGWTMADGSWQPLFVPFVSVSPTVVLMFGADVRTVLTGGVLGGLVTPPLSVLGADVICPWLGVPPVVGVTGGMAVGAVIAFTVCRRLPWLPAPLHLRRRARTASPPAAEKRGPTWLLRRGLADFSEAQFFGSEWASFGLILGVVMAYLLNPALPAYGSGLLPQILAAQVLTAVIAVVLWRGQWARRPFYPTFVPVVSVAPACVLAYGGTAASIIAGAVLGAVISPPLAAAISSRLPTDFHPFIGNVAAMAIATSADSPAPATTSRILTMTDLADTTLLSGYFRDHDIDTIAQDLRNGRITSVELVQHSLTAIDRLNPILNAFATVDADAAWRPHARPTTTSRAGTTEVRCTEFRCR